MKKMYCSIKEKNASDGYGEIGTICYETLDEFKEKINIALLYHFDEDVTVVNEITEAYMPTIYEPEKMISILINKEIDGFICLINTWLY